MRDEYHITFLRHAESLGNSNRVIQGHVDYELSMNGKEQAQRLWLRWQKEQVEFDYVISSPLIRAIETADIVTKNTNLKIIKDVLWIERNTGDISGLHADEADRLFPKTIFRQPYAPFANSGEGEFRLYLRAGEALLSLLEKESGRYLIVSHGGILNQAISCLMGIPPHPSQMGIRFRLANTGISKFIYHPEFHQWEVVCINDAAHLAAPYSWNNEV